MFPLLGVGLVPPDGLLQPAKIMASPGRHWKRISSIPYMPAWQFCCRTTASSTMAAKRVPKCTAHPHTTCPRSWWRWSTTPFVFSCVASSKRSLYVFFVGVSCRNGVHDCSNRCRNWEAAHDSGTETSVSSSVGHPVQGSAACMKPVFCVDMTNLCLFGQTRFCSFASSKKSTS